MHVYRHARSIALLLPALLLAACSGEQQGQSAPPPPAVGVMTVKAQTIDYEETLPGRLEASRVAEVRARVSGIVEKRLFTEGSDVKAGDMLFRIDDAPYQARLDAGKAQKARAEAQLYEAEYQAERYERLVRDGAVSEHELIQAKAQLKQAKADLLAAEAQVKAAAIDLDYTRINAPISGRIGRELVTEGALVSQSEATPMALIQQTDPMYINVQEDSRKQLQRYLAAASGQLQLQRGEAVEVELLLDDDRVYPHKGRLLFRDINVDRGTGQQLLRIEMPNPDGMLLPGMFARVRLAQVRYDNAFLVPQQAVSRSDKGSSVMIVGEDNVLEARPVTVAGSMGKNRWLITSGLEDGETLMVDGFQKAQPGKPVTPVRPDEGADEKAADKTGQGGE